jgi:hypothetical protein
MCFKQVAFHCPPGNKVMAIIRLRADDSKKNSKNIDPSLSTSKIYDFSLPLSAVGQVPGAEWGRASSRHGGGKILPRAHLVFSPPVTIHPFGARLGPNKSPSLKGADDTRLGQRPRSLQINKTSLITAELGLGSRPLG